MAGPVLPTHVVMFGRPGSGKSSMAERLSADFGFRLVQTGQLLREAMRRRDPIGLEAERVVKGGRLVPDSLIGDLLEQWLKEPGTDCLLFDGFPRTLGQVPILERFERTLSFRIDCFVEIRVSHDVAVSRMTGRRVCPVCGATYHLINHPPRDPDRCDHEGAVLEQRRDDSPDVIEVRQRTYDEHTQPVVDSYRVHAPERFISVDGEQPFEAVYRNACRAVGRERPGAPRSGS